ncbi:MAG: GntR family transcriptional regulator [Verrucomicrobiae bacterium]|nr:GntR family transcriptional regulator [Verrucomicrobiae bacterium]
MKTALPHPTEPNVVPEKGLLYLRPRDRVMKYLKEGIDSSHLKNGDRLPPIRDLAECLNVSTRTVQVVIDRLKEEGRIQTHIGNGSFLVFSPPQKKGIPKIAVSVPALVVSDQNWGYQISVGIMKAATQMPEPCMLVSLPQGLTDDRPVIKKLKEIRSEVDGLILFPYVGADEVRDEYERAGKPVVDLTPPSMTETSNFVSPDFFGAAEILGRVWGETGRRNVVFVVYPAINQSMVSKGSYLGLLSGLKAGGEAKMAFRFVEAQDHTQKSGHNAIAKLLNEHGERPDAIYCTGDFLALGAAQALQEKMLRVPEDASVVGGTGLHLADTSFPSLTRLKQPFEELGAKLLAKCHERIQKNCAAVPAVFLRAQFIIGKSTLAEENARLSSEAGFKKNNFKKSIDGN